MHIKEYTTKVAYTIRKLFTNRIWSLESGHFHGWLIRLLNFVGIWVGFSVILQNFISWLPDARSKSKHISKTRIGKVSFLKTHLWKWGNLSQECPSKASEDMSLVMVVSHDLPKLIVKKKGELKSKWLA